LGTRLTLHRPGLTSYQDAWELQQHTAERVRDGGEPVLILLQHPPTYTIGARGKSEHLLLTQEAYLQRGAEVHQTDRGGDVTFHGPGQVVGYPVMNVRAQSRGPVSYVRSLESMLIDVLARFGITGERSERNAGVWVGRAKIAAIGVRISRGITTHGFALNVNTDLSYFDDIVPCGLSDAGVTSIQAITGETFDIEDVETEVASAFARTFEFELIDEREEVASGH
jgi:lipoyl(octanoyl) transferase